MYRHTSNETGLYWACFGLGPRFFGTGFSSCTWSKLTSRRLTITFRYVIQSERRPSFLKTRLGIGLVPLGFNHLGRIANVASSRYATTSRPIAITCMQKFGLQRGLVKTQFGRTKMRHRMAVPLFTCACIMPCTWLSIKPNFCEVPKILVLRMNVGNDQKAAVYQNPTTKVSYFVARHNLLRLSDA